MWMWGVFHNLVVDSVYLFARRISIVDISVEFEREEEKKAHGEWVVFICNLNCIVIYWVFLMYI